MTSVATRRTQVRPRPPKRSASVQQPAAQFVRAQVVNTAQGVTALRPFRDGEFGTSRWAPSRSHLVAVNELMEPMRKALRSQSDQLRRLGTRPVSTAMLGDVLDAKGQLEGQMKAAERIWDWYFEMFSQRSTRFGRWLHASDVIALDCYQVVYTGLGVARSIPAPAPFSYLETGFTPSTFRRGVRLTRLGKRANPFPVVQVPLHRMVNPWTLGAINHEVSHNLQSDLGLWGEVPRRISARLNAEGLPRDVVQTWTRWHKEIWADLAGLLLGGPEIVTSLMDVVSKPRRTVARYNDLGVHPTPFLRPFISTEVLRRIGFEKAADTAEGVWRSLYPKTRGDIPKALLTTAPAAIAAVTQTICFDPYPQLGGKSLASVIPYPASREAMVEEAARRLAAGTDPGIVPPRLLIGASRVALDRRLARPGRIAQNFYEALAGRPK